MTEREMAKAAEILLIALEEDSEEVDITLDSDGSIAIEELLAWISHNGFPISEDELMLIVDFDWKQRFIVDETFRRISLNNRFRKRMVGVIELSPPKYLYHATASRFVPSILSKGILPQERFYVHLASNKEEVYKFGEERHGSPVVFEVNSEDMAINGYKFFMSETGIWLTSKVPPYFLKETQIKKSHEL